jgi:Zn-finger nucleic acid-binding protein
MKVEAPTYHCTSCGAPVAEATRRCGFCAAPVASVRCAHCFQMNVTEAVHCSGCGRRLGLEPVGKAGALECPRCDQKLEAFSAGNGKLYDCNNCGGQFVEHALLRQLLEQKELYGGALPRRIVKPQNPLNERVVYVKCPSCSEHMNRKNFGESSGVIVDICPQHGSWFDTGELPRVLAFVEQGGLERTRKLRAETERRRERERRDATAPVLAASERSTLGADDASVLADVADIALSLLELVRK